jgi:hypothetical protein
VLRALKGGVVAGVVLATSAAGIVAADAGAPTPLRQAGRHIGGVIPVRAAAPAATRAGTGSNLIYHGGRVLHSSATYAIYWLPRGFSMGAGYQSTIDRYFADAAADSGRSKNVYSTLTQYYDAKGPIRYRQTFAGSTVDASAFPKSGCPRYQGLGVCLSDAQVAGEVRRVAKFEGWAGGLKHAFFLFLPKDVGTCFDGTGQDCAFSDFCAYHGYTGASRPVIYANVPYADVDRAACSTLESPHGNDADDTLNSASHEHREMTNDPLLNAWFDRRGFEGSDKCAYDFGTPLGSAPNGDRYNQVINGHLYYLQQEWSNASTGCVQRGR